MLAESVCPHTIEDKVCPHTIEDKVRKGKAVAFLHRFIDIYLLSINLENYQKFTMYSRIKCWASGRTVKDRINMIHQKVSKKLNNAPFLKQRLLTVISKMEKTF